MIDGGKLGVLAGLGMTATARYRQALPGAFMYVMDTADFLSKPEEQRRAKLLRGMHELVESGCTHAAVACVSYQTQAQQAATSVGLTLACDILSLLPTDLPTFVLAHSRCHDELWSRWGAAFPTKRDQVIVDSIIDSRGLGRVSPDDELVLRRVLDASPNSRTTVCACTDLPDVADVNLTRLHIERLTKMEQQC